uniref:Putative secreted protein n=1 Tax=Anopheles darlingi TaxID=43151 RepID=A0A2M4DFJ3_ANODA
MYFSSSFTFVSSTCSLIVLLSICVSSSAMISRSVNPLSMESFRSVSILRTRSSRSAICAVSSFICCSADSNFADTVTLSFANLQLLTHPSSLVVRSKFIRSLSFSRMAPRSRSISFTNSSRSCSRSAA